ncbi:MAG: sensor domain-containing diguanylate cyclase [Anaerolineales bacterium]
MKNKAEVLNKTELRRQAEAKLSERKLETGPLPAEQTDVRRLVHELEVHQIQLEMQNEELMQIRAKLEAALRQYTDLYDFAPVGYLTLERDGTILQVNLTGAKLLGIQRGNLVNKRFGLFVSEQSRSTFNTFLEKVIGSQRNEECEVELIKDGGDPIWVHIEAACDNTDEQGKVCHAALSDITKRKQAELRLIYLSSHDVLTGLYNRNFFIEEMARLERGRRFPISIVVSDVDHLKAVNDQQGHAAGDALLRRVAQVLTAAFRADDVIARIGGDEFAVLLPRIGKVEAQAAVKRIQTAIRETNSVELKTPLQLSVGVSTAEEPMPLSDILKDADANMYREKRGRNGR